MNGEIRVPRLGWSMDEGTFVEWLKRDGEAVKAGEPLFVLESDKSAQDIEALDGGVLRHLPDGPSPGDTVKVGQLIGRLETADGGIAARSAPVAAKPTIAAANEQAAARPSRVTSSPRARRAARELGVDWTRLAGTGRGGRVRERDVRGTAGLVSTTTPTPGETTVPLSPTRRTIAARMAASRRDTTPVTLTTRAVASNLVRLRDQFKATARPNDPAIPGYTDLVIKLVARVLADHPLLNARRDGDRVILSTGVHVGLAVDTDTGLVVPVIRDVARLGVRQLAARSRDLIARARARVLTPEDQRGGTFTVTSLGKYGVDAFTPIINPPETAILGLGTIRREPAFDEADRVVPREYLTLSLTFDHQLIDGAPAARFLQDLSHGLANVAAILVE